MIYDKIKESEEYKIKKLIKGGHDIPLKTSEKVVEYHSFQRTQKDGKVVYLALLDGEKHPIKAVVSACCSAGANIGRLKTCHYDSSKKGWMVVLYPLPANRRT